MTRAGNAQARTRAKQFCNSAERTDERTWLAFAWEARALAISPETAKSHVKRIFLKLAAASRIEAVPRAGRSDCYDPLAPDAKMTPSDGRWGSR